MAPGSNSEGPVLDYLLKEVSFSTCDNRFFGELEKEMLIPNNVNIYGRIKNAANLKDYKVQLDFPEESSIAYIKQPVTNTVNNNRRILVYNLEELLNFDDYWWLPLAGETEFTLPLNLLPPFPDVNPVDLQINCRPDVVAGLEAEVTTSLRIEAEEPIDNLYLKLNAPPSFQGISMAITKFTGDNNQEPRANVLVPNKEYPFPRLSLEKGEALEYKATTEIKANPLYMNALRCQQDILGTRLVLLSHSTPDGAPCGVKVLNPDDQEIPVDRTVRSTILQANAQIMYSPFSIRKDTRPPRKEVAIPA